MAGVRFGYASSRGHGTMGAYRSDRYRYLRCFPLAIDTQVHEINPCTGQYTGAVLLPAGSLIRDIDLRPEGCRFVSGTKYNWTTYISPVPPVLESKLKTIKEVLGRCCP